MISVERQISLQNNTNPLLTVQLEKIQWTGSRMELVELLYALHEAGCFGKTALKTLFAVTGKTFDCKIANYSRLFWDIRNRTTEDRTFFLNKLHKTLSDKFIRMDSGARS